MTEQIAPPTTTTFYPVLRYRDPQAAIDWLVTVLGFTPHIVELDDDGKVDHAELRFGTGIIMLGNVREGLGTSPGEGLYYYVDDVDGYYAQVRAAGGEIATELHDSFHGNGTREFHVRDLEGRPWYIGTYRP
jgi:uncharacterized glyoxalase superfamily protein PhnB